MKWSRCAISHSVPSKSTISAGFIKFFGIDSPVKEKHTLYLITNQISMLFAYFGYFCIDILQVYLFGGVPMFDNLVVSFLGDSELLAYNDTVAALFSDYRINDCNGIHLVENRKLTEAEMDELLENIPEEPAMSPDTIKEHNAKMLGIDIEDGDAIDTNIEEQIERILDKIITICPETKYMIHGYRKVLAATPERIEKKRKKSEDRKSAKKSKREALRKEREQTEPTEPTKQEQVEESVEEPKKEIKPATTEDGKAVENTKENPRKPPSEKAKKKVKPIEVDYGKPAKKEKVQKPVKQPKKEVKPIDVDYGKTADGKEKSKTNKSKLEEIKEFIVAARQKSIDKMGIDELEKLDASLENHEAHLDIILSGSTGANDMQKDYAQKLSATIDKLASKCLDKIKSIRGEEEPEEKDGTGDKVDKDKESQEKRYEEEEKMKTEKDKEGAGKEEEETPNKFANVGKPKYEGFLGLMFKMFTGLADPQKKADKKELQQRIRRDWATYKKNEKFLKENKELVEMLEDKVNKKQFDADSISIFNEIIARDPTIIKKMDLERNTPDKVQLPLKKFTDVIKGLKTGKDIDNKNLATQIKEYFKKQNINISDIKIDDTNISKPLVNMEFNDWNDFLKITNDLALKQKDLG